MRHRRVHQTLDTAYEQLLWAQYQWVCGVDEVGRGPLAGPVVAAAVMFERGFVPPAALQGVADSKQLSPSERADLAAEIRLYAAAVAIGVVDVPTIDRLNILNASFLAMSQAIAQLSPPPDFLLIDGNSFKSSLSIPFKTVVKGDSKVFSIAAASIVAKVYRDAYMIELDAAFPQYGFARHFGYPTPEHIAAIRKYGRSPLHRQSFKLKALGE
ncbi:MAG: ribonuclease HII [Chloroherpetonaceae bacterium]|nr:ribonuclease HII [Chloroherpetonaceae bacterium]MDW8019259.1 ribonuclease HII [Chloroherpetonaceae bacterium]